MNGRVITSSLPWGFRARLTKPHDGDSFWMLCDTGFDGRHEPELRLDGVHAPEIHPLQPGATETLAFVNGWLASNAVPDRSWPFWTEIVMKRMFEPEMQETFTRFVATVWPFDNRAPQSSLNWAVNLFLSGHPEWPSGD